MAVRKVVVFPDDRLRRTCSKVTVFDDKLKALVQDMFDTMYDDDGIGLAGPQVGIDKRIVVIDIPENSGTEESPKIEHHPLVLINPVILDKKGQTESNEGCLSVPGYYDTIQRAEWVKLEAQDENGEMHTYETDGLLAICFQHETDHLDGHLFIDYLSSIKRNRAIKYMQKYHREQERKARENA